MPKLSSPSIGAFGALAIAVLATASIAAPLANSAAANKKTAAAESAVATKKSAPAQVAVITVGSRSILLPQFESEVRAAMRKKYYHGTVPEAQLLSLQREVADRMVEEILLLDEAKRRGLGPRAEKLRQATAEFDQRYGGSPNWQQNREEMLGRVRPELERRDLLEQMETVSHETAIPTDAEVKAFYNAKKELFTEPERTRLSLILLKVDPSAPRSAWDKASEEASAIHKRLKGGADFAELARLHSGDESAARGGDMGYLHRGMLHEALQVKVDDYKVGEVQEPVVTLYGPAIIRVDEKVPPKLRSYEDVKTRASELLRRERADAAGKSFLKTLRGRTDVRVRDDLFAEIGARLR